MTTPVLMPQFTETMVEGVIGKWLKAEGDWVKKEEPLVEIVTDKVVVEMPSPVEGRVARIITPEDTVVKVGGEMAILEEVVAEVPAPSQELPTEAKEAIAPEKPTAQETARRYSPVVRRLAREYGIDLEQVQATGAGGRVTKEDVMAYVATLSPSLAAEVPTPSEEEEEILPITPVRRLIADHMVRSVQTSPHVWASRDVDVTRLVQLRENLQVEFLQRGGVHLTYLPFFIKAVVEALKENPILNSMWTEGHIIIKKRIHIGVAIAVDGGLVVPVIKDAHTKSITPIAEEVAYLTSRAQEGKLSLEDVQGGTFTVNNSGALGTVLSMPIIHQPQAAILNMDAIVKRAVVVDDAIAIRSMMNLCISFDHRILDGAQAARFLQQVRFLLESYGPGMAIDGAQLITPTKEAT